MRSALPFVVRLAPSDTSPTRQRGYYALLPRWRFGLVASTLISAFLACAARADEPKLPPPVDRKVDFVKDVQPLFAARCYECHGPKKQESAFRLDHKGTAMHGGEIGQAIVPGKSAESPLVKYVAGVE